MGVEANHQAKSEICEDAQSAADSGMAGAARSRHCDYALPPKPDHPGLEQLLPGRCIETAVRRARQLDLRQGGPVGASNASAEAVVLVEAQILGKASPQEERRLGLSSAMPRAKAVVSSSLRGPRSSDTSWSRARRHPTIRRFKTTGARRRSRRHAELSGPQRALAARQKGLCPHCRESLHNDEPLSVNHIRSRRLGGEREIDNQRLMHLYCHLQALASEKSARERKRFA